MGVDDVRQLFGGTLQLQSHDGFGDHLGGVRADDVDAQDLAVLGVADDLDEALMRSHNAGARVGGEREFADLHFVAGFLRLGFGQANAANLGMAVSRSWNAEFVNFLHRLAGDVRHGDDAVDARLGSAHVAVDFHVATLDLDLRLLDADVLGAWRAADGDQNLFGLNSLLLAVDGEGNGHPGFGLLDLLDSGADESVDTAFAIDARQFLRDLFIFDRHVARQHFQDGDVGAERLIDAGELDAYSARADHDQRFRDVFQAQDFNVGEDLLVGRHARQHARDRAGRENHVLGFDRLLLAAFESNGVNAAAGRAGQLAIAANDVDLVLAHEELQAFGVLVDDALLALLNIAPVQGDAGGVLQAEFRAFLSVVENFGVEQQRLGRNTA